MVTRAAVVLATVRTLAVGALAVVRAMAEIALAPNPTRPRHRVATTTTCRFRVWRVASSTCGWPSASFP